jgi:hypothetical protein
MVEGLTFIARLTWVVLNRYALAITLALVWAGVMLACLIGDFT